MLIIDSSYLNDYSNEETHEIEKETGIEPMIVGDTNHLSTMSLINENLVELEVKVKDSSRYIFKNSINNLVSGLSLKYKTLDLENINMLLIDLVVEPKCKILYVDEKNYICRCEKVL